MEMPTYNGVIENWKIQLIITRARMLRFRSDQLPDALQEVVLELLNFKYDPNHANGATEKTAITTVIDNCLRKMKRSATRYRFHLERLGEEATEFSHDKADLRSIDIASVIAKLTTREQVVCYGLADGLPKDQIAKELGCSWHTVNRIICQLHAQFKTLELDGWLCE